MKVNYQVLKQIAQEQGLKVTDLIALAPQNDPFYCGSPGEVEKAEWFAGLWRRFGYSGGVHLRRVHYQLISQPDPRKADGGPYQNTENDWNYLLNAGKYARYLGLVNPEAFVDRRNPDAILMASYWGDEPPGYELNTWQSTEIEFPTWPELPNYRVQGFDVNLQPYHLEVWVEKTTMNDVLRPLCSEYKANLVTGAGEMSITACLDLVKRIEEAKRPARIFYISDFDPAGYGMPISVARKIEFLIDSLELDQDIRLEPVALTKQQVIEHQLPRTPIKETELRKGHFEEIHGEGAVELDALEALYPGTLRDIVQEGLDQYYDHDVAALLLQGKHELFSELNRKVESEAAEILEDHPEWADLEDRFIEAVDQFRMEVQPIQYDLARFMELLLAKLDDVTYGLIDPKDYFPQEVKEVEEGNDWLYDSRRSYAKQLTMYKMQRAGNSHGGE
jgi:hypothetical protein